VETGLYYINSRYYDSKITQFLSKDTYTGDPNDPLGLNLYTYCANNPIKYKDPTGHVMVGDDKLSGDVQAALMDLTAQWNAATTKAEKDRIHDLANDYRSGAVKPTTK